MIFQILEIDEFYLFPNDMFSSITAAITRSVGKK